MIVEDVKVKDRLVSVDLILHLYAVGWTQKQVREKYPHLSPDTVRTVFALAAKSIDDPIVYSICQSYQVC